MDPTFHKREVSTTARGSVQQVLAGEVLVFGPDGHVSVEVLLSLEEVAQSTRRVVCVKGSRNHLHGDCLLATPRPFSFCPSLLLFNLLLSHTC